MTINKYTDENFLIKIFIVLNRGIMLNYIFCYTIYLIDVTRTTSYCNILYNICKRIVCP